MSIDTPLTAPEPVLEPYATETWGERIARYEATPGWQQRPALEYDCNMRAQDSPQWEKDPIHALQDAARELISHEFEWTIVCPIGAKPRLFITGLTWRTRA